MAATIYTAKIAAAICEGLVAGKSMRVVCQQKHMPGETTVYRWLQSPEYAAFREQYARARESQAERMLDEILEIADDTRADTKYGETGPQPNAEWISRSKLRVDARKWAMSKLAPKKYGDKLDLTSGDKPLPAPTIQIIAPA